MKRLKNFCIEIFAILLGIVFVIPVLFVLLNSFKTQSEIFSSFISFPSSFNISNYLTVWNDMNYLHTFMNTLIVTVFGVTATTLVSSMISYKIARMNPKWGVRLLLFFALSMMVPFQTIMIPLMKVVQGFGINETLFGYILVVIALFSPFTIFLYNGFIQQIPIQLEEAAYIDGASAYQTFFRIVFPLMKPIITTSIILNTLWVWNDFILSLLILQKKDVMTLQLTVYRYFGTYNLQWHLSMASLILATLPVIIFFIFMQKYIQESVVVGAVKG
jgi:raffinose/stachyose/melibiose transport system permease protein